MLPNTQGLFTNSNMAFTRERNAAASEVNWLFTALHQMRAIRAMVVQYERPT